jgi:hypothetical protein
MSEKWPRGSWLRAAKVRTNYADGESDGDSDGAKKPFKSVAGRKQIGSGFDWT